MFKMHQNLFGQVAKKPLLLLQEVNDLNIVTPYNSLDLIPVLFPEL